MFIHVPKPKPMGRTQRRIALGQPGAAAVCPAKAILLLYLQLLIRQLIPTTTMQPQPPCWPEPPGQLSPPYIYPSNCRGQMWLH